MCRYVYIYIRVYVYVYVYESVHVYKNHARDLYVNTRVAVGRCDHRFTCVLCKAWVSGETWILGWRMVVWSGCGGNDARVVRRCKCVEAKK